MANIIALALIAYAVYATVKMEEHTPVGLIIGIWVVAVGAMVWALSV